MVGVGDVPWPMVGPTSTSFKPGSPNTKGSMASTHCTIREATPSDLSAILHLYQAAGITAERAFCLEDAGGQLAKFARYPFYRVFVALSDNAIVGTYEFLLMDNLAKAGAKSAIVEDVAVDPAVQGKGIGRAMMQHARELARAHGAYKLALSSNQRRQQAHAFYESLGFERHGISFAIEP